MANDSIAPYLVSVIATRVFLYQQCAADAFFDDHGVEHSIEALVERWILPDEASNPLVTKWRQLDTGNTYEIVHGPISGGSNQFLLTLITLRSRDGSVAGSGVSYKPGGKLAGFGLAFAEALATASGG